MPKIERAEQSTWISVPTCSAEELLNIHREIQEAGDETAWYAKKGAVRLDLRGRIVSVTVNVTGKDEHGWDAFKYPILYTELREKARQLGALKEKSPWLFTELSVK